MSRCLRQSFALENTICLRFFPLVDAAQFGIDHLWFLGYSRILNDPKQGRANQLTENQRHFLRNRREINVLIALPRWRQEFVIVWQNRIQRLYVIRRSNCRCRVSETDVNSPTESVPHFTDVTKLIGSRRSVAVCLRNSEAAN